MQKEYVSHERVHFTTEHFYSAPGDILKFDANNNSLTIWRAGALVATVANAKPRVESQLKAGWIAEPEVASEPVAAEPEEELHEGEEDPIDSETNEDEGTDRDIKEAIEADVPGAGEGSEEEPADDGEPEPTDPEEESKEPEKAAEETTTEKPVDVEALRAEATALGLKYHPQTGAAKLTALIEKAKADATETEEK